MNNQLFFIEIEIGSFCNRVCPWCPNAYSTRGREKNYMTKECWEKIICSLSRKNYSGEIAFHNYNEPLADDTIYQKINCIKNKLPNAEISIFTNGDYLSQKIANNLIELDVNNILVTLYPENNYFKNQKDDKFREFLSKLNLKIIYSNIKNTKRGRELNFKSGKTNFNVTLPIIGRYTNRACMVKLEKLTSISIRKNPCFLPKHSAAIDYKGNLKLCCQIYDVELQEYINYNIGNINHDDFYNLWNSNKMNCLRQDLSQAKFNHLTFCNFCNHSLSEKQVNHLNLIE